MKSYVPPFCKNCNSRGTVKLIKRSTSGMVNVYLRCGVCRVEQFLYESTPEKEKLRHDIIRLSGRIRRYKNPPRNLERLLEKKLQMLTAR